MQIKQFTTTTATTTTRAVSHKNTPYVNDSLIVKTPSIYANNEKKNTQTCHASSLSLLFLLLRSIF